MHSKTIYVVLLFSLLVTGCFSQNNLIDQKPSLINWESLQIEPKINRDLCTEMSPQEIDSFENIKKEFTSGLAIGFLPEDFSISHKMAYDTYWVDANEQLSFDWFFWYPNGNEKPATLRLLVLLDEHQLSNAFSTSGLYHDINLEKGNDLTIKVNIPPLTPGVHDLIIVGIPYPQNDPDVYGSTILVYRRITLIAEPVSSPFRNISFAFLPAEGSITKGDPLLALELTLKNNDIKVWNWPNPWLHVHKDTPTRLYALAGYADVINQDAPPLEKLEASFFSLLLFKDYQQIEVAPNQMAFYGKVTKDTAYVHVPFEIPPLPEGKHSILVIRIDTPGVPVCILKGDPKGRIIPNDVYGKLVGLEVLPTK